MGQSTDGQICYGVLFEEEYEFPWDRGTDGDLEGWWIELGNPDAPFYPFTPEGEYKPGVTEGDPRVDEYYDTRRDWLKGNPIPVELVNVCSGDYPVYILAVPGTVKTASRGFPERFNPQRLEVDQARLDVFDRFITEHGLRKGTELHWYLSSYWG